MRAHEGFLVVFRLGGAMVDVPPIVAMSSFAVHIVVIDLAKGESGHKQPQPIAIGEDELVAAAAEPTAKASARRGRPRRARS